MAVEFLRIAGHRPPQEGEANPFGRDLLTPAELTSADQGIGETPIPFAYH